MSLKPREWLTCAVKAAASGLGSLGGALSALLHPGVPSASACSVNQQCLPNLGPTGTSSDVLGSQNLVSAPRKKLENTSQVGCCASGFQLPKAVSGCKFWGAPKQGGGGSGRASATWGIIKSRSPFDWGRQGSRAPSEVLALERSQGRPAAPSFTQSSPARWP